MSKKHSKLYKDKSRNFLLFLYLFCNEIEALRRKKEKQIRALKHDRYNIQRRKNDLLKTWHKHYIQKFEINGI